VAVRFTEQVPAAAPLVAVVHWLALRLAPAAGALKLTVMALAVLRLPLASSALTVRV